MIILGLTGSIGMGKSTTAGFFADAGIPVYSADEAVRRLYRQTDVINEIAQTFAGVVDHASVDHEKLAKAVFANPAALRKLEAIVHPRVHEAEAQFLQKARQQGHKLAVLDIPLLYETGGQSRVDYVAVVTAPTTVQRKRVLARPGMTEERLCAILARQMPDEEKRQHADFIIDTHKSLDLVREDVRTLIHKLIGSR